MHAKYPFNICLINQQHILTYITTFIQLLKNFVILKNTLFYTYFLRYIFWYLTKNLTFFNLIIKITKKI